MSGSKTQNVGLSGVVSDRRPRRGKNRWYLVHAPNREQSTCDKLKKIVPSSLMDDAFVLRKERWRKQRGEWTCDTVPLFRDYCFVATADVEGLAKELSHSSLSLQIAAGDGRTYATLPPEAQAWYERMTDGAHVIRSSLGVIVDGELQLQEGPLVGQEANVIEVNRPKRFCLVAVGDGSGFSETVPLVVPFRS